MMRYIQKSTQWFYRQLAGILCYQFKLNSIMIDLIGLHSMAIHGHKVVGANHY